MTWHQLSSTVQRLAPLFAVIVLFADAGMVHAQTPPPAGQVAVPSTADEKQATGMMVEFQKIMAALRRRIRNLVS